MPEDQFTYKKRIREMFCGQKLWQRVQCICRRPGLLVALIVSALLTTPYLISENFNDLIRFQETPARTYNESDEHGKGFIVWNPKCQILDLDPLDQSIRKFVKIEKFEACTKSKLLTKIIRRSNGEMILKVDKKLAKNYVGLSCCWAPIQRPKPTKIPDPQIDFEVSLGSCADFEDEAILPEDLEVILVKCKAKKIQLRTRPGKKNVYENVHGLLRLEKVMERMEHNRTTNGSRKLSVLILGMDNVSRLNFERSMPKTIRHLKNTGWKELKGYNKIADNTFPNLMAILTGLNASKSHEICTPTKSFGLDNCPFIWYAFRNASYVTAYGEDATAISTFDYMKAGFVNPPTDFYLRPYIIAAEKYLTPKRHLNTSHYCTGPEPSGDRILNYALDFAKTFTGIPYFGFFWTNTMSHDNMNGPSSVDGHLLEIFQRFEHDGILNDSMLIFLSDHGLRYGVMRETVQGWYEEKLPFGYIWLPEWFKEENPKSVKALASNERSLTSPFNVYQTLREVLIRAGGNSDKSGGCPQCQSLFSPVPNERGCDDVGVEHHWCSCTAFRNGSISGKIALEGARKIVRHIDNIAKKYRDSKGRRICASLRLKRVLRVNEMVDSRGVVVNTGAASMNYKQFLCQLQVTPGNGKFEAMIRYYEGGNLTIIDNEVSRINTYKKTAKCLNVGSKQYCFCA